jgi:GxxExxY protein
MNANEARINEVSNLVIGCAFTVANILGSGFLEKVYDNALAHEIRKRGLGVVQQGSVVVMYDGVSVGEYATDLLVEDLVLVELRAVKALDNIHQAQCRDCQNFCVRGVDGVARTGLTFVSGSVSHVQACFPF